MRTLVAIGLVVLVLGGALWWLARSTTDGRGARPVEHVAETAAPEPRPAAIEPPAAPTPTPSATPDPRPTREAASPSSDELARATWIEGRVVFPEGTPADEEAYVLACCTDLDDLSDHRARVAQDGTFRVAFHEETRRGSLWLEASYLYLERMVRWKAAQSSGPIVLEPKLGARLVGTITVPIGIEPRSVGGTLRLYGLRRSGDGPWQDQVKTADLPPKLAFAFDAVPVGADLVHELRYDGPLLLGVRGGLELQAGKTLVTELALRPGVTLAGVVRDAQGRPFEGASVTAHSRRPSSTLGSTRRADSAADGRFRLGALEEGEVTLTAQANGYQPVNRALGRIEEGTNRGDLELVLGVGHTISGVVRWPDGSPAQVGVSIVPLGAQPDPADTWGKLETMSGADGAFRFTGLRSGAFRVAASAQRKEDILAEGQLASGARPKRKSSRWTVELERVPAGTRDLVLTLTSGLALEGIVADDLGVAVARFRISARRLEDSSSISFLDDLSRAFDATSGSFRLEGFTPGYWEITARSPGHAEAKQRVSLPATGPLRLVLPRAAIVRGRVVDPTGSPVPKARLAVEGPEVQEWLASLDKDEWHADSDGRFEIAGLTPGPNVLHASGPGFAASAPLSIDLAAGVATEGVELVLRTGATLVGEVRGSDGRPAAATEVWVHSPGFDRSVQTDAEGRFSVAGLPAGEVSLWAELEEGIQLDQVVRVEEGETRRVLLSARGALVRLHGHVLAGGQPLADAELHAHRAAEGEETGRASLTDTDAEGAFELRLPGPGRYVLTVLEMGDDSIQWQTSLDVPPVAALAFDVSIPIGRISGRVTDEQGEPLAGIEVWSEPEQAGHDTQGSAETRTDAEGRYELRVPAGRHTVEAGPRSSWPPAPSAHARGRVSGLVVAVGDHRSGVDLRLAQGGSLAGIVRNADGSPAGEVVLWQDTGARFSSLGYADDSGRFEVSGLPAGPLELVASHATGATREPVRVAITAGETARVEITLVPAAIVRLSVRQGGSPAASDLTVTDAHGRRHPVQTAWNGETSLRLVAGHYTVRAQRDGQTVERSFEVAPGGPELALELVFD